MSVYNFPNSGGLKENKDHDLFTTAADVAPGASGAFTRNVLLGVAQKFKTNTYDVGVNQTGGGPYAFEDVDFRGYPLTGGEFYIRFTNNTGVLIPAGTVFELSYRALGI
jgi:hypothetical protein